MKDEFRPGAACWFLPIGETIVRQATAGYADIRRKIGNSAFRCGCFRSSRATRRRRQAGASARSHSTLSVVCWFELHVAQAGTPNDIGGSGAEQNDAAVGRREQIGPVPLQRVKEHSERW